MPNGLGLLPTAARDAQVILAHVALASQEPVSLEAIKMHMGHVLHAADPSLVTAGPGSGYGVRAALSRARGEIEEAGTAEGASENVRTHARHVAACLEASLRRIDAVVALAQQIQGTNSVPQAVSLLQRLATESTALAQGRDTNGDRLVGWETGEAGLKQATEHMTLMKRGEGLLR